MERSRPNNVRCEPSQIRWHLCFHCGDQFSAAIDYQKHLLYEHQAMSLCYQIYHAEKAEKEQKLSISDKSRRSDSLNAAETIPGRRHTAPESIGKEDVSYKKSIGSPPPLTDTERQLLDQRKERKRQNDKDRRHRKREEAKAMLAKQKSLQPDKVERETASVPPKRVLVDRERAPSAKRVKTEPFSSTSSSSSSSSSRVPSEGSVLVRRSSDKFILRDDRLNCPICQKDCPSPCDVVHHAVSKHQSDITKMEILLFSGETEIATKVSKVGTDCSSCNLDLPTANGYCLHLLRYHSLDVLDHLMTHSKFSSMDNFAIRVVLTTGELQSMVMSRGVRK